jgi:hypothetical protein
MSLALNFWGEDSFQYECHYTLPEQKKLSGGVIIICLSGYIFAQSTNVTDGRVSPNVFSIAARERFEICEVFPNIVSIKSTMNYPTMKANVKHNFCVRGLNSKCRLKVIPNPYCMFIN